MAFFEAAEESLMIAAEVMRHRGIEALGPKRVGDLLEMMAKLEAATGQIIAWHQSHVSNGPTEAINNLVKRVKRTAFGFRRFEHYRIRALLYAGRPNWSLLDQLTPP